MKSLLALLILPICFAQQRYTAPGGVVYTNPGGFGNVAYPGTGAAPQPSFGNRAARPGGNASRQPRVYAYPVYVGGGYYGGDSGYASQSQAPVNVTVVNAPPQAPSVVINQNFGPQQSSDPGAAETTRVYRTPPSVDATADAAANAIAPPHYFLVAFKDHSVYSAFAYWIEDKTLHYVTPQQTHNQASLDLIDMDLTKRLNQR